MYLELFIVKSLPWPIEIDGSKLYFYCNIFLLQYCVQKYLLGIGPNEGPNNLNMAKKIAFTIELMINEFFCFGQVNALKYILLS